MIRYSINQRKKTQYNFANKKHVREFSKNHHNLNISSYFKGTMKNEEKCSAGTAKRL